MSLDLSSPFGGVVRWLADYQLLSCLLLAAVAAALAIERQPVRRMAALRAALAGLTLLAALCAVPGWSLIHLATAPREVAPPRPAVLELAPPADRFATQLIPHIDVDRLPTPPRATTLLPQQLHLEPTPTPTPSSKLSLGGFLLTAYATGSASVTLWLLAGAWAARRLRSTSLPCPAEWETLLAELARGDAASASSTSPALRLSSRINTPVALGIRRPMILIPGGTIAGGAALSRQAWLGSSGDGDVELRSVLAHELAHVRHGDLATLAWSRLLLVMLWPQPLYWLLRSRLRLDQETLADAAAAEASNRLDYAARLLAWARNAATSSGDPERPRSRRLLKSLARAAAPSSAVGLWESPSQLKRRIATLVDDSVTILRQASRRWRWACGAVVAAAAVALSTVTLQPASRAEEADHQVAHSKREPLTPAEQHAVDAALATLRSDAGAAPVEKWGYAARTLIELGPKATPAVCNALDDEARDHPLRRLAFVLRGIGDKRAVPALIRALPRTLLSGASDYGLRVEDAELGEFLRKYDLENDGELLDYGRAFREVAWTLRRWTGQDFGELEINFVFAEGDPPRRAIQRRQYAAVAARWQTWWESHWQEYVDDPQYAKVNLPARNDNLAERAGASPLPATEPTAAPAPFPIGPAIRLGVGSSGSVIAPARAGGPACFYDLDTGRQAPWPQSLPAPGEELTEATLAAASRWAAGEGFDLLGLTERDAETGGDARRYVVRSLDLKLWKISDAERTALPTMMRGEVDYPLGRPVDQPTPTTPPDSEQGPYARFRGAGYLFATREGTRGVLVTRASNWGSKTAFPYPGVTVAVSCFEQAPPGEAESFQQPEVLRDLTPTPQFDVAVAAELEAAGGVDDAKTQAEAGDDNPLQFVAVMVADEAGKPLAGATVQPSGFRSEDDPGTWWGWRKPESGCPPADPVVTGANGIALVAAPTYVEERRRVLKLCCTVTHPDFADGEIEAPARGGGTILLKRGGRLDVTATADGKPIPAERLRIQFPTDGNSVRATQTPAGALQTPVAEPGPCYFRVVEVDGGKLVRISHVEQAELAVGVVEPRTVKLRTPARLVGRLDDSVPRPIRRGHVQVVVALPEEAEGHYLPWREWARVEPDGSFVIAGLPPGETAQVIAICEGYTSAPGSDSKWNTPQIVQLGASDTEYVLPMARAASVAVTVRDDAGRPLPGVLVASYPNAKWQGGGSTLFGLPITRTIDGLAARKVYRGAGNFVTDAPDDNFIDFDAVTNERGEAALSTLPAHHANESIVFEHDDYELPKSQSDSPRAREIDVELQAGETVRVEAQLQRTGKEFLGEADVKPPAEFTPATGRGASAEKAVEEKPKAGDTLDAAAERLDDASARLRTASEELQRTLAPNVLQGVCFDEARRPLAGVEVTLYLYWMPRDEPARAIGTTTTGEDGRYRFEPAIDVAKEFPNGVPPDHFNMPPTRAFAVVAKKPGRTTAFQNGIASQVARRGETQLLQMQPAATLRGRVVDDRGQPVAGARVTAGRNGFVIQAPGIEFHSARTDAQGQFEIVDVAAYDEPQARAEHEQWAAEMKKQQAGDNMWTLTAANGVAGDPYAFRLAPLEVVHPDFALTRGTFTQIPGEVQVTLSPAAVVAGRVVRRDGANAAAPAAGVTVVLTRLSERLDATERSLDFTAVQSTRAVTDDQGRYRVGGLPPGTYGIGAETPDDWVTAGIDAVSVVAGKATTAPDLELTRGGVIRAQLVDAATGEPLQLPGGAKGWLHAQPMPPPKIGAGAYRNPIVTFSADGVAQRHVPPGRYVVFAMIPDEQGRNRYTSIEPGTNVNDWPTFEVGEGGVVEVRLKMRKEEPQAGLGKASLFLAAVEPGDASASLPPQQAIAALTAQLKQSPDDLSALIRRAELYDKTGQLAEAIADFRAALKLHPTSAPLKNNLADLLATAPVDSLRDGAEAVRLAAESVAAFRKIEGTSPEILANALDTLAAAQAEAGDFAAATKTAEEAIRLLPGEVNDLRLQIGSRYMLYREHKPYRRPTAEPAASDARKPTDGAPTEPAPDADQGADAATNKPVPVGGWTLVPTTAAPAAGP